MRDTSMKHSIKKQMAGIFIGVLACSFILVFLANALFLEKFYLSDKQKALVSAYEFLNQGVNDGLEEDEDFVSELNLMCATDNISAFVMDNSGEPLLYTERAYQILQRTLYSFIFEAEDEQDINEILAETDNYVIRESHEYVNDADYLEIIGTLDSGEPFVMQTTLESLRDSANISNRFLVYIGIIVIAISSVVIYWFSRRFSDPVLELAEISKRMTELDFDAKFTSDINNEIGVLGANINQLSEALEETISELKTANNELKKDIEKKDKIDEMRREFISNVSHELKTPIALIQGYAEGLKECINDDPESRDFYCEVIMDEAGKMNKMVKNLISLNRLEFGNDIVEMERFDIVSLVRNVINSTGILLEQKEIRLIFDDSGEIYVWADEYKIEEVVTNYISNAINHCDYDRVIEVKLKKNGGVVRLSVFNTGDPIPEGDIDKIWIKFYKVDKARTREYGGSGIGLSIVKAIAESLNQECGVINYDNGVEFWFEIDASPTAVQPPSV